MCESLFSVSCVYICFLNRSGVSMPLMIGSGKRIYVKERWMIHPTIYRCSKKIDLLLTFRRRSRHSRRRLEQSTQLAKLYNSIVTHDYAYRGLFVSFHQVKQWRRICCINELLAKSSSRRTLWLHVAWKILDRWVTSWSFGTTICNYIAPLKEMGRALHYNKQQPLISPMSYGEHILYQLSRAWNAVSNPGVIFGPRSTLKMVAGKANILQRVDFSFQANPYNLSLFLWRVNSMWFKGFKIIF